MPLPVTIGITTKNRESHLATTIAQLAKIAPGVAELLVVDDGSAPPVCAADWGALPFPVRLVRHDVSTGYIAARNEIARDCRTAFLLSCDDDSRPIAGDLAAAVTYLAGHPELIALSFPYQEGPARRPMNPSVGPEPYPVRQFIGCSHLMRVDYFLQLGGYWEWLVQQNEERELCYRASLRGWGVAHYPGVTFHHDYTPMGRNWDRHEHFTMRNEMAVELRYAPWQAAAAKLLRNGALAAGLSLRRKGWGALRGYFAGWWGGPPPAGRPRRLTLREYQAYRALPWC